MNKLSFEKLLEELEDSSKQQKLHALEDGEFLSHFEVSQIEVEELYTEIEGEKDGQAE